ncbi:NAD(P)/FAD-dependent oxidoreductase [Limnoglobus roseus]|uniref:FAD-binding oxidoreductase n=1 Tax=Limnoglobus roseus TaxID=2598579 RepID=A0A5C1AJ11_9BACT|nr:FAD-dependent oxidoreductase [Limnoglobus roseus]QEL16958.1 FAD-binding oxidoreductase [Limnoglobus roseus]
MTDCDVLIVGQGLAGTTLAWQLLWRGVAFHIVDRDEPVTASKIAAGLITPITGKRVAASWRYDELFTAAVAFYRRVESQTGTPLFSPRSVVRLFQYDADRKQYEKKRIDFGPHARPPAPPLDEAEFRQTLGGFEMPAGQLRVPDYLHASRAAFGDRFRVASVDASELEIEPDGARVPSLGLRARAVVFCQGFWNAENPLFRSVPFTPAKGEILTLRVPDLREDRTVNRGVWLVREGGDLFRVGSTYDRENLDHRPTAAGREEICTRLREFLRLPFEVVDHRAAVRPIVDRRKLLAGVLPHQPRVGFFNGLSSKGSLWAPHFAGQLADVLSGRGTIDAEVDLARHWGA